MLNSTSYDDIWSKGILPLLTYYCEQNKWISLSDSEDKLKERIWNNYKFFNERCRQYMKPGTDRLDRHKVSACYMLAIIKSNPLLCKPTTLLPDKIYAANEQISISIGLRILQGFILSKYNRNNNLKSDEEYERDKMIFENGFFFPEKDSVGHGAYRNNFAIELYFTAIEENYNILSLSHSLYLLELYNRMRYDLKMKSN